MNCRSTTPRPFDVRDVSRKSTLPFVVELDVLVDGGRVRRRAPEDGLRRLEPLGLDVEAVLGPEGAPVRRQEDDVVLLDDRVAPAPEAVVVKGQRRLAGAREPEEQEADVARARRSGPSTRRIFEPAWRPSPPRRLIQYIACRSIDFFASPG